MATKQTYTATATWSAAQLAGLFQSAFIDAGLMTGWFDSFLSGTVENRILEVRYDNTKTYGTTYYWFMFTTGGVFVHTALSWNAASDIPSGTQFLDFFSNATNTTTNHRPLVSLTAATTTTLTRYTSTVNAACSWFVIRNGTTNQAFFIPSPGYGPSSTMVDLNRMAFNGMLATAANSNGATSFIEFIHAACHTRRTFLGSAAIRGNTSSSSFTYVCTLQRYISFGNVNSGGNNIISSIFSGVMLPTAFTNTNPALAADYIPVFTGPTASPYMAPLPTDFGVAAYYASNAMTAQDTLVVTAGTEEWEMLSVANNTTTDSGRLLFLARVV